MIEKIHNDKLLMDCFHENLDEPTLSCYMSINTTTIKMWSDLDNALHKHNQLNIELASNRNTLYKYGEKRLMKLLKDMLKDGKKSPFKSTFFYLKKK